MRLSSAAIRQLEQRARDATKNAYSPYSHFPVGAAVLTASGKVFSGSNVENASFGLCNCAERTAVFTAIASGEREIHAVAIYTPTRILTTPCGACRQVLNEFGPDAIVISICDGKERLATPLAKLLPSAFGPKNLKRRK